MQGKSKPRENTEAKRKSEEQNMKLNVNEPEIKEQKEVEEQEYTEIPEKEPQMILKDVHDKGLLMEPYSVE